MNIFSKKFCAFAALVASSSFDTAFASETSNTINPYINPLGLVTLSNGLGINFKVHDRFALGPAIGFFPKRTIKDDKSNSEADVSALFVGVRGNFNLTGVSLNESGWYLGPEIGFVNISIEEKTDKSTVKIPIISIGTNFGYHWVWNSGFNLALGLGARYLSIPSSATYDSGPREGTKVDLGNLSAIVPVLELSLGFAF